MKRPDNRTADQLRPISFVTDVAPHSTGSVLVCFGDTRVICSAMVQRGVPRWMKEQNVPGGWLTAEYSMLPYSTGGGRKARDISRGKLDGRSSEIQRLIGRALRAVVDLKKLKGHTVWVDCDVLQADGGTRTASITGASVACSIAFERMVAESKLQSSPLNEHVSAVSCGVYEKEPVLDLCYLEDRDASVDFNIVLTEGGEYVELQGSGEETTFSETEMSAMLALGKKGALEIVELQRAAVLEALGESDKNPGERLADFFGGDKPLQA